MLGVVVPQVMANVFGGEYILSHRVTANKGSVP